jgi:hypothetical protein
MMFSFSDKLYSVVLDMYNRVVMSGGLAKSVVCFMQDLIRRQAY